eukprot:10415652-Karenia_brevis.AAC.1
MNADNKYVVAGKEQTERYDKEVKMRKSKGEDPEKTYMEIASPSVWCFNGMVTKLLQSPPPTMTAED